MELLYSSNVNYNILTESTPENDSYYGDYDEEPDFSDPEDFVDEITGEELMPEIMKQKPKVQGVPQYWFHFIFCNSEV